MRSRRWLPGAGVVLAASMHGSMAQEMDHSTMDHSTMDHSTMDHSKVDQPEVDHSTMDHSTMDQSMTDQSMTDPAKVDPVVPITPIPELTEADRIAALPPAHGGHAMHDNEVNSYVLLDRLEAWNADAGTGLAWNARAWLGTDTNRLWLRSEGERDGDGLHGADLEVLYGRSVSPWWDLVAGVRQDFAPGSDQAFAAIGVMGLAPQKFEVQATAYVGAQGQTAARIEVEYTLLFSSRWILQPMLEANLYGKDDPSRGIGSGLSTLEGGLRLRYEVTRQFAPYVGLVRERAFGGTADDRRDAGEAVDDTRLVLGIRAWF